MDYKVLNFPDAMKLASVLSKYWDDELEELTVYGILADISDEEIETIADLLLVDISIEEIVLALRVNQINELMQYYEGLGVYNGRP